MTAVLANAGITLGVAVVLVVGCFALAVRGRRYDLIDSLWGLGFAVLAVVTLVLSGGGGWLVTVLTVVWGVRLAGHIHTRNRAHGEDRRYTEIRARAGDRPRWYLFTRVYLSQAVLLWFVSLPVQVAQYEQDPLPWPMWAGLAVWVVGFGLEAVADHQLRRFRADPAGDGQVLDTGLWRYSRHPNYFGDACVWWGLYLAGCGTWAGAAIILSPVVMTALLAKGTGKPLLEKDIAQRRPGYVDYVARTSGFVPLPPRTR